MLINLPYPQKNKARHFRFIGLLSIIILFLFIWNPLKRKENSAVPLVDYADLESHSSGELSVLTYNIAGLPELISSATTARASSIRRIGERITSFDIVNVQEDFNYNAELYALNGHDYRTQTMGGVPFGDGLSTLSKYPIMESKRIAWTDCSGSDCLTPKGFSYTRIQISKDVFVDVYNVHATAQDHKKAVAARKKNMHQLAAFIKQKSACQALIIMGDFNAHYAFSEDNVREFKQEIGLIDTWVMLQNAGRFPAHQTHFVAQHALTVSDHSESIDKIYFRNSDELLFKPKEYQVQNTLFSTDSGEPLSDHCAISLKLEWELTDSLGQERDKKLGIFAKNEDLERKR